VCQVGFILYLLAQKNLDKGYATMLALLVTSGRGVKRKSGSLNGPINVH
jgi:hypothetical protein